MWIIFCYWINCNEVVGIDLAMVAMCRLIWLGGITTPETMWSSACPWHSASPCLHGTWWSFDNLCNRQDSWETPWTPSAGARTISWRPTLVPPSSGCKWAAQSSKTLERQIVLSKLKLVVECIWINYRTLKMRPSLTKCCYVWNLCRWAIRTMITSVGKDRRTWTPPEMHTKWMLAIQGPTLLARRRLRLRPLPLHFVALMPLTPLGSSPAPDG